jgi:hypothetical protein
MMKYITHIINYFCQLRSGGSTDAFFTPAFFAQRLSYLFVLLFNCAKAGNTRSLCRKAIFCNAAQRNITAGKIFKVLHGLVCKIVLVAPCGDAVHVLDKGLLS